MTEKRGRERSFSPSTAAGDPHRSKCPVLSLGHSFPGRGWANRRGDRCLQSCACGPALQPPHAVMGASVKAPAALKDQAPVLI